MRRCFDAGKIMIHLKQLKAYLIVGLLLQWLTQVHWYLMESLQFQQKTLLPRLSDLQFQNNLKLAT